MPEFWNEYELRVRDDTGRWHCCGFFYTMFEIMEEYQSEKVRQLMGQSRVFRIIRCETRDSISH